MPPPSPPLGRWPWLALALALCSWKHSGFVAEGGSSDEDAPFEVELSSGAEIVDCEHGELCWSLYGPYVTVYYETLNLDPAEMDVQIIRNRRELMTTSKDAWGEVNVILSSPHERPDGAIEAHNTFTVRVVMSGGTRILKEQTAEVNYDLSRRKIHRSSSACPVTLGSQVLFDYRAGDGHGTHQPVLHTAVLLSSGPIVEFGMGTYSTLMLHELCKASGRRLVSFDTEAEWVAKFEHLRTDWHQIQVVPGWEASDHSLLRELLEGDGWWGVVFADQHPESARSQVAVKMLNRTEYVVIHDSYRQLGAGSMESFGSRFRNYHEYMPPRPFPVLPGPPTLLASQDKPCLLHIDMYTHDQWCKAGDRSSKESVGGVGDKGGPQWAERVSQALVEYESRNASNAEAIPGAIRDILGEASVGGESGARGEAGLHCSHYASARHAVLHSKGDVVALGGAGKGWCGLRDVCEANKRTLFTSSAEGEGSYHLEGTHHATVRSWAEPNDVARGLSEREWGVVILDQYPLEARVESFWGLVKCACYVVMHDFEMVFKLDLLRPAEDLEGYRFVELFPHRPFPSLAGPSTLLVCGGKCPGCSLLVS